MVYDSKPQTKKLFPNKDQGREQGSLYSQQKRKIADACEYLRLTCKGDRVPLVFTLTSPGLTDVADNPKFISNWFENMRTNYSMGEYVWVREYTKKGFPHFHCVADWHKSDWFFDHNGSNYRIEDISLTWSKYFNSDATNSIWLGGYWYGKRIYHLRSKAQCRYLVKYFGKGFNARSVPSPGGVLQFQRIKDVRECLQSVRNLVEKSNQNNLNQGSKRKNFMKDTS